MRLPWWPIYLDARFDEQGVHFAHPECTTDFVPWHLVGIRGQYLVCYDHNGSPIRVKNAMLLLRYDRASKKDLTSLQQLYLHNSENSYALGVDPNTYKRNLRSIFLFLLTYTVLLPLIALTGMIHGYRTVPLNESGVRYQHAIVIGGFLLVLTAAVIQWRVWRSYMVFRRSKKIVSIDQNGINALSEDSTRTHHPWHEVQRFKPGFTWYLITMQSGDKAVIPQNNQAWSIASQRSRMELTPIRRSILSLAFIIAILSGPFMCGWFSYLLPDDPLPPHMPWVVSAIATFQVLSIAGLFWVGTLYEKRKRAKSEE